MTKQILACLTILLCSITFAYGKCACEPKPYITYEGWRCLMQERSEQLDIIKLKDGRIFRGTFENKPDLQYCFGCIGFEPGEVSVYAFGRGCVGEKVQAVTFDGRNFVAAPDCQQVVFSVYKPYSKDSSDLGYFQRQDQQYATQQQYPCYTHQNNCTERYTQPYGYYPYGYGYGYYNYPYQNQDPYVCNFSPNDPYETPQQEIPRRPGEYIPEEQCGCTIQYDSTTGHYVQYNMGPSRQQEEICYEEQGYRDGDAYCMDCTGQPNCERVRSEGQTEARIGVCTRQYERMRYEFTPDEVDYVIVHEGKRCVFSCADNRFSVELTNGDQLPVEICGCIRVNNGYNDMLINPKGTLEMRMAGGASNRYTFWDSLPRAFAHVVIQDAKLDVRVSNDKRILSLPWKKILSVQGQNGTFSTFAQGMPPCYHY